MMLPARVTMPRTATSVSMSTGSRSLMGRTLSRLNTRVCTAAEQQDSKARKGQQAVSLLQPPSNTHSRTQQNKRSDHQLQTAANYLNGILRCLQAHVVKQVVLLARQPVDRLISQQHHVLGDA
jgi:hypothetical protein